MNEKNNRYMSPVQTFVRPIQSYSLVHPNVTSGLSVNVLPVKKYRKVW